jgi:hypothetical protein
MSRLRASLQHIAWKFESNILSLFDFGSTSKLCPTFQSRPELKTDLVSNKTEVLLRDRWSSQRTSAQAWQVSTHCPATYNRRGMLGREKRKERFKEKLKNSKEITDVLCPIVI